MRELKGSLCVNGMPILILLFFCLPGCRELSVRNFYIQFNSEPPGARVYSSGDFLGTAPFTRYSGCSGFQSQRVNKGNHHVVWSDGTSLDQDVVLDVPAWNVTTPTFNVLFMRPPPESVNPPPATVQRQPENRPVPPDVCDLASLPKTPPEAQPSLAVIDFLLTESLGNGAERALADLAREVVQRSSCYVLLDRENIRSILGEADFASAVRCDETSCLVDYGKRLRAQKMMHGRIGRIGSSYVLTITLTDVATAKVDAIRTSTVTGSPEAVAERLPTMTCELLRDSLQPKQ